MQGISRFRTASLVLVCLSLLLPGLAKSEERKGCSVCGMYLDAYASTEHVIVYADGTRKETCSIACAAKLYAQDLPRIKEVLVADYLTHELTDAARASYLEGSDAPPVMSAVSRIAFRNRSDAEAFRKKHGGKLVTFDEAVKHQLAE